MESDPRTYAVIGAAMEVHSQLGCGFLEAVYQEALELELAIRAVPFERQRLLPLQYKGHALKTFYRADFICYSAIILEIKSQAQIGAVEEAQVINYLKATGFEIGLLLNFGRTSLQYRRFILDKPDLPF